MEKLTKQGGYRKGAGRPPELEPQLREAKKLAKEMQGAMRLGLMTVAKHYPDLIERALNLSLNDTANKDSARMLSFLLELLPKMVKLQDELGTEWDELTNKIKEKLEEGSSNTGVSREAETFPQS